MMKKLIVLILFLCLVGNVNALITNGDFEADGTSWGFGVAPIGWTNDFNIFGQVWETHTGVGALHPGDAGFVGGGYQDITTVIGEFYDVSLWIESFAATVTTVPPDAGRVKVLIGSPGTDTYTFENGTDTSTLYSLTGLVDQSFLTDPTGAWSQVSFQFQAIDTTLRFGVYSNPYAAVPISINVDDISVTLVPEPATLALLGLGGVLIRKRRV